MYDRKVAGRTLNFEASGALKDASLVMRDRETDSWWSIMTSDAIGGSLDETRLTELPWGEKVQFGDWHRRHPDTLVLSVEGVEHIENNPYDNYFTSEDTFRGLEVDDDRLRPKAPIYSFRLDDQAYAAPHTAFVSGRLFAIEGDDRHVLLHRRSDAEFFASSDAYLVDAELVARLSVGQILDHARREAEGTEPLGGFDTFWYNWIAVNPESELLR